MHVVAAVLAGLSCCLAPKAPPAPASAFVRVNQVGYPADATKRAYLMSSVSQAGTAFSVKNASGSVVYSGTVGASLGTWSAAFKYVQPLDFDTLSTAGSYTVSVGTATSPAFRVDSGQNLYATPIANGLSFYQTERDGPDYIPNALRTAPGHLNDQNAMTYAAPTYKKNDVLLGDLTALGARINAAGGWWDAGDYIKGVETISYTTALLLHGVREFPAQLGSYSAEAKFGTDWLLRMWDDSTRTFYYQVGLGDGNTNIAGDHDLWRLPQADDTYGGTDPLYKYIRNRPVFAAGPARSTISPNLAGRDAASFATCFQLYKRSDAAFAARCLTAAEHIFDLANTSPGQLTTYSPFDFYPETEWRSDLELGATELYFALAAGDIPKGLVLPHTDPLYYLTQAAHWASAYMSSADDATDTLNLYDVSGLAHYELYKAIAQAGNPAGLETTQSALLADLKKALDGALAHANGDPFQFGFPWDVWDTTSHGAGLVVMASEYDQLTGTNAYMPWTSRWAANILGANAWGVSLIVGDGSTFPRCIHHQVANISGALDGTSPILKGAAVEGTNGTLFTGLVSGMRQCPADGSDPFAQFNSPQAKFRDEMESFSTVEPAVDLTATSPLAFARLAAGLN
jgi:endoglucanase